MSEPAPGTPCPTLAGRVPDDPSLVARAHAIDEWLYAKVATTSTPLLDEPLRRLSHAANYSRLWVAAGAGLAVLGGPRGRRAAVAGLTSVAVTSAAVNLVGKLLTNRRRPDRAGHKVVEGRWVPMPTSTSFPSGHSASAFAFAEGVRGVWPAASVPLFGAAALVAYSRVHTGVHYPGDVAVGSAIGIVLGHTVGPLALRAAGQVPAGGDRDVQAVGVGG
jgi:membrane-associated phospholipid phosphatase